ncbi:MAG TPA: DUF4112 domain-containing protein [Gammaproteobacteria bacterium]|nr:DUF4112 domain-containing protein [Gammaproteobacteria bacterium]
MKRKLPQRSAPATSIGQAIPAINEKQDNKGARLRRLARLAKLLDGEFRVPGTGWRFGLDPLIGLIPGVGDAVSAGLSLWIVIEARRLGAPAGTLMRMLGNIVLDFATGVVPVLGDIFDAGFKANLRNVALLERAVHIGVR